MGARSPEIEEGVLRWSYPWFSLAEHGTLKGQLCGHAITSESSIVLIESASTPLNIASILRRVLVSSVARLLPRRRVTCQVAPH